jgi:predicted molibdopterin-dependent oxidoreductase YjgC
VVLPAAGFAEKEGTFTNFERRVQRVRKAIEPLGDSLPDWEILLQIASKMGCPIPYSSPQQIMDEIEDLVPLYQNLTYSYFEREDLDWIDLASDHLGARRLYKGSFPAGFGRFSQVEYTPPTSAPNDGYPLTLLSGSILHHFGSGTRSLRASRLKKFSSHAWVEISEVDAKHLGYSGGDLVKLVSPAGEVTTKISVTDTLPSGTLFMPISFPESPVNELFGIALDPQAKTPSLKTCAVRLERTSTNG